MRDKYFWQLLIRNITELEFESLNEAIDEKASREGWESKTDSELDSLRSDYEELENDYDKLESELDDLRLDSITSSDIAPIIDLIEDGDIDTALQKLREV